MRNIAQQMTAAEIDEAVHYYTGRPALVGQDAARQGRYLYRYARPLPKPSAVATSRESFSREDETKNVRCRRQGAFANPVAADAIDAVAIDWAGTGADRGPGDRPATAVELVCDLRRRLA